MTIEDLQYIFQPQLTDTETRTEVSFILRDGNDIIIKGHPIDDLSGLLTMLDSFHYAGSIDNLPRFVK